MAAEGCSFPRLGKCGSQYSREQYYYWKLADNVRIAAFQPAGPKLSPAGVLMFVARIVSGCRNPLGHPAIPPGTRREAMEDLP